MMSSSLKNTTLPRPSAAKNAADTVEFSLLTSGEAFLSLADEWDDLLTVSAVRTPFMRWDWLELWWQQAADDAQLLISLARDANGYLLALVPLMIRPSGDGARRHLQALTFLGGSGEIDAEGLDAMVRPGHEHLLATCWDRAFDAIQGDWDIAQFSYLDRSSPLLPHLTAALERQGIPSTETNAMPSRCIPLPDDWDSYTQSRSKNFRRKLKKWDQLASASFHVETVMPTSTTSAGFAFQQLIDLHADRWSIHDSQFLHPRVQSFHSDLIQRWFAKGRIALLTLNFDGRPVAANYAFIDHDRMWDYQGGWLQSMADYCPSKLILAANIRHAIDLGLSVYDFLPGPNPYKVSWCPDSRQVFDLECTNPSSLRATLFTSVRSLKRALTSLLPGDSATDSPTDPA